jgi:tetratricopeptide (TPR) repeat protein
MKTLHFKAFISYSHQDESWARWLQKALESYRVPKHLVGSQGQFGAIPPRLSPVFRDREDLSSSADLSSKIRAELEASETLLVICSPAAVRSKWVNEEIRFFHGLGREDRIFALIVDGDPQSRDPAQQCFPPALAEKPDGSRHEPLAADARKYADGRRLAKLKLVAGVLGIRLDELRRRDSQRRRRNWMVSAVAMALFIGLTASLAITAISSKKMVALQRTNTEELLSYMLGDLKSLDPIVGLEVIDQNDEHVRDLLQNLGFQQMDNEQLVATALAWRDEGQVLHVRAQLDDAMALFQKSRAAFMELYQREEGSKRAMFELGQAEFYVGYIYMDKGELDQAQASFTRYGAITRRLVNADPNNAEMVMELSYTLTNLSALERARRNPDIDKSLQLSQSAMQYNQIALVLDPQNSVYRQELSKSLAFLADAWRESCDLGKAYEFRQQNVALSRQLAQEAPQDDRRQLELAYALSGLATVQQQISLTEQAQQGLKESEQLLRQQLRKDAENRVVSWQLLLRKQRLAWLHASTGDIEQAWDESKALVLEFASAFDEGRKSDFQAAAEFAEFGINHAVLAHQMGDSIAAAAGLQRALDSLTELVREKPQNRASRYQLARAAFEQWLRTDQLPSPEVSTLLADYLAQPERARSCDDASLAARLAMMRGDKALAASYTSYLLNKGFFDPEFIGFCKEQGLCE